MKQRLRFLTNVRSKTFAGQLPDEIAFLPMEAVGERGEYDHECVRSRDEIGQGYTYFERGDIVRAKVTPCFENGKGAILGDLPTACGVGSTELIAIAPRSNMDPRFLYYVMMSAEFVQGGEASLYGAHGVKRVPDEYFRNFRIWAPELARQRAIADYLDRETASVDSLLHGKLKLLALLRERHVAARRREYDRAMANRGPIALRRLSISLDGRRVPLNSEERSGLVGQYAYWGSGGVLDHINKYLFDEELVLLGEDGAPFFDKSRDVAFVSSGRVWINNHIHVLRCTGRALASWLRHMLNAVDYAEWITGSTRDKLTQGEMMAIRLPNVPVNDQEIVARGLDIAEANCQRATKPIETQITLLNELRQSLITGAVSGQIRITSVA
jgi:type I restriction enzyme S subunit